VAQGAPAGDSAATSPPRRDGRWLRRTTTALVVALLATAAVAIPTDLGERLGVAAPPPPDPVTEPAEVPPPPGLTLPLPPAARPVAAPSGAERPAARAVRGSLQRLVTAPRLGRRVAVQVAGVRGGPVYRFGVTVVTPASTMKLLTAQAALQALGPDHRFATTVMGRGARLVLVGGGDPLLARAPAPEGFADYPERADLTTLARRTAGRLRREGRASVRLAYDASLFAGPSVNPHWEPDYVPDDVVSPISALWVDEGRAVTGLADRSANPPAAAAAAFAAALRGQGIVVRGPVAPGTAGPAASELARVESAPVAQVVQHVLEISDNEGAEVLARHVALAQARPASFSGAARAVTDVLASLDVDLDGAVILDGSGLSRGNRLPVDTLLDVLAVGSAPGHPEVRATVTGLPVAGFTGSLAYRFETGSPAGLGSVRAKTGTLTGVHGLAGVVTSRDGLVMRFVAIADRVREPQTQFTRDRLDQIASALAACTCG
jgi:D-alanyl-D-alanine carboxypeptidase/D-alanyl-D-alanine-endopeptidase (penicillin-binding protein 4)